MATITISIKEIYGLDIKISFNSVIENSNDISVNILNEIIASIFEWIYDNFYNINDEINDHNNENWYSWCDHAQSFIMNCKLFMTL